MISKNKINLTASAVLILATLTSFYIFSRFTVDDAFISWRYGRNLIEFGVWNYNPTRIDMVQAYTNPVFALISILSNFINFDVVFFFKMLSILTVAAFIIWFRKRVNQSRLLLLGFICLPGTIIHAFSGLETFLFVFLLGALLISLYEEKVFESILLSSLLFITRPESWIFAILTPIYFAINDKEENVNWALKHPIRYLKSINLSARRGVIPLIVLSLLLIAYFIFHYIHFGDPLPNTFHIKSGARFSVKNFLIFAFFSAPAILAATTVAKRPKFFVLVLGTFCAMIGSYSTSDLQMNYAWRFAFHIFAPSYFLHCYFLNKKPGKITLQKSVEKKPPNSPGNIIHNVIAPAILFSFFMISTSLSTAFYYPRALISHAQLGRVLEEISEKYNIKTFAFGDAGMAAYYSKINVLDNVGLANSQIGRHGLTREYLDYIKPDMAIFYATPSGIRLSEFNQGVIFDWVSEKKFVKICDIYFTPEYLMTVYAKTKIPEIQSLCKETYLKNSADNKSILSYAIAPPPWTFWKE
ncbi:hypothetical protein PWG14_27005 [Chromobacterium amazonense]|uniref:hypothetical protein n=1 Tax=Chromobacterium amazonense TaxID=1382803 RepID=UPI00237D93BE|nr:hypothetical protein [Chromobacterium amazonense]MDE1716118.1 hypothetical protein [Chromobacterium amazonense]